MKLNILYTSPCVIFYLSEMFSQEDLQKCFDNFPLEKKLYKCDQNGKFRIENDSREMVKILSKFNVWQRTIACLSSPKILKFMAELERAEGRIEGNYAWESLNPLRNLINKYFRKKTLVKLSMEFSLLSHNSSLVPHTDSRNKLVTMMLYFPEPAQENRKHLGTTFHDFPDDKKANYENFSNQHYTESVYPDFYSDHQAFFQTSFSTGKAYGFLKNSHSWHSVSAIKLKKGEHRRSLNVNIYKMNQSCVSPLWTAFKRKVKQYV